jgi:YegS/Rv2252/BmrU family lipid kinase
MTVQRKPPADRRRILVIYNPAAGRSRRQRLDAVVAGLQAAGCDVLLRATTRRGDAEAFARESRMQDHDVLLAAGGDGTINEVVNGLTAAAPPLALCPMGTANVLAAEIGLMVAPEAIVHAVLHGTVREIWPGDANGRHFLMMAGVGFDAEVVAGIAPRLKRALGKGAYVVETLRQLVRYRYPRFRVVIDGVAHDAASAIIANGRFYAGRYVVAPQARLETPAFQVCLFRAGGPLAVLWYGTALLLDLVPRLPGVTLVSGARVEVSGPPGPVQGDGDIIATLPLTATVAPQPVRLLTP